MCACCAGLSEFLTYVANLTFDEMPDYEKCRDILRAGLIERGYKDDGKLVFMSATPKPASKKPKSRLKKVSTTPSTPKSASKSTPRASARTAKSTPVRSAVKSTPSSAAKVTPRGRRVAQVERQASPDIFEDDDDVMSDESLEEVISTPTAGRRRCLSRDLSANPETKVTPNPKRRAVVARARRPLVVKTSEEDAESEMESLEEKENNSPVANPRPRARKPVTKARKSPAPVKKISKSPVTKAKRGRAAAAKKKTSPKKVLTSSVESLASLYDNPTPAMRELLAKKQAKAAAGAKK